MRRNGLIAGVVGLAVIGVGGATIVATPAAALQNGPNAGLIEVGKKAPAWTLPDADGDMHSLEQYRGKVVVMDFWATWCGPCKMAMPGLQNLHEEFKDRGVVILGINTWERDGNQKAIDYMDEHEYTYGLMLDGDKVAEAYGVRGIPTFYVIGVDGTVIKTKVGFDPEGEQKMAEFLDEYLAEQEMS
ncbi:MAG: peroxiredoxin family protein [Phycisphaerales bacterium]